MRYSETNVRPCESDGQIVVHAQPVEGEDDGVEACGLFVQVVVVVCWPFDAGGEFGVHCIYRYENASGGD